MGKVLCLFSLSLVIMMGKAAGIYSLTSYLQNSFPTLNLRIPCASLCEHSSIIVLLFFYYSNYSNDNKL